MSDDIEAVREGARAVRTAESMNLRALMSHVSWQRMFYLVPGGEKSVKFKHLAWRTMTTHFLSQLSFGQTK